MVLEGLCRERQKNVTDSEPGSEEWSLKMIAGAARLSAAYVSRNPKEVWFQLYARLRRLSKQSEMIKKYLADTEKCAERPWVKASLACLPAPGGSLQNTALCDGHVKGISVGNDGSRLFVCGTQYYNGPAFVSTVINGEIEKTVILSMANEGSSRSILITSCNRDGTRAVTGHRDGSFQLWNAETGEMIGNSPQRHGGAVRCVAWSADGKLVASGSWDITVRVWDAKTGEPVGGALRGHGSRIECVAWSEDGKRLASGSKDGMICVWTVWTGETVPEAEISPEVMCDAEPDDPRGHALLSVRGLAWSADGRLVSISDDLTLRVWNGETEKADCKAMRGQIGRVQCIALSSDGKRLVSGSDDLTVRLWDVDTGEAVGHALCGHSLGVCCVAWSAGGKRVFSGSSDGTVRVWDVEREGVMDKAIRVHSEAIRFVVFSEDGKRVVSGSYDETVRVWDTDTGETVGDALRGHRGSGCCAAWSVDGRRMVSGSDDGTVRMWDAEKGEAIGDALRGYDDLVQCVAWSVDGNRVASVSKDKTARLWDAVTGMCLKVENRGNDDVSQLRSLLGDENTISEGDEEEQYEGDEVILGVTSVRYRCAGVESIIATLENDAEWAFSKVGRKIAAGQRNGAVDFFQLVV